jgi:hypothetical protein
VVSRVKITLEMIEAARQVPGDDVSEYTIHAALEAAISATPAAKGGRPSPALASRIVTTRTPPPKTVAIPKPVVWTRKPRPRR